MAKPKKDEPVQPVDEAPEKKNAPESEAPPAETARGKPMGEVGSDKDALRGLEAKYRDAEREEKRQAALYEEHQRKKEEARRQLQAERQELLNRQARKDANEATVPVIVQTKKERVVRIREGNIKSRTPVKVSRRGLRKLQGMMRDGRIQLIVGELEKPGAVIKPLEAKKKAAKDKEG